MQVIHEETMHSNSALRTWIAIKRWLAFAYGLCCYSLFFGVFLYMIGFVGNYLVTKSIDSGPAGSLLAAIVVNGGLIGLFGVLHSVMARGRLKEYWLKVIPLPIERSTYVLVTSLLLALLFWQWRPMPGVI